jgi:hypothetical protein
MLVDVAKCELALDVPTGLRTKRSHVRVVPGASSKSHTYGHQMMPVFISLPQLLPQSKSLFNTAALSSAYSPTLIAKKSTFRIPLLPDARPIQWRFTRYLAARGCTLHWCAFGWLAHLRNSRLRLFTEDTAPNSEVAKNLPKLSVKNPA